MTGTFVFLPPAGSSFWQDAVADVASLPPAGAAIGECRFVINPGAIYEWNGAAWVSLGSGSIGGAGVANRIAYFSGVSTLTSSAGLLFDGTNATIGAGTAGILGRTDGSSAASGVIGELITATQAALTTTGVGASGVFGNVTSVSVPAGDWDVWGVVRFNENGATLTDSFQCGISASTSGAGIGSFDVTIMNNLISSTQDLQVQTPIVQVNISSTTTYYLNTMFGYSAGTPKHSGKILLRRRR